MKDVLLQLLRKLGKVLKLFLMPVLEVSIFETKCGFEALDHWCILVDDVKGLLVII
jgi:hypothetical protein